MIILKIVCFNCELYGLIYMLCYFHFYAKFISSFNSFDLWSSFAVKVYGIIYDIDYGIIYDIVYDIIYDIICPTSCG